MRVAVILLACLATFASAQYQDGSQRGLSSAPIRTTRFQRLPSSRSTHTQAAFANQRIRRPVSFRAGSSARGGSSGSDDLGISAFPAGRTTRPNVPTGAALSSQIKPVNEEPEEDVRDIGREHEEEEHDQKTEQDETIDDSEENVARAVASLGAVGSTGLSRGSGNIGGSSPPHQLPSVQYRANFPATPVPTGRGGGANTIPSPIQYQPAPKPTKPRKPIIEESFRQQVKPTIKPVKPSQVYDARGKKPVAQIIRRYRNDNPDGSITWGFENDDGSYKEEVIGVDCITRGKYGYIDPDGIRREYTYETGIKCDEEDREEEEDNGFVDYQENKLVLPDGKTIDLSTMGKKQGRRPRPAYGK